ncbi:MAG: hypothetical protein U9O98_03550 [Asgard group archaeon]|nr:hypothetical protein [Asgard group archaeon]
MELKRKRRLSIIFIILTSLILVLGITGVIIGVYLAMDYKTGLLWASFAGILPLSVILGIIALIFDISYRKEKRENEELIVD